MESLEGGRQDMTYVTIPRLVVYGALAILGFVAYFMGVGLVVLAGMLYGG